MKKPYSLDYSIQRDVDRVQAIREILDTLERKPTQNDLELMANYILYGKDENDQNAVQRGETTNSSTRYDSYKRKDDTLVSLDEMLENPLVEEAEFSPLRKDYYVKRRPTIQRPKYNKQGELIDVGDGDIPGMQELWEAIDHLEHWIGVLEGKVQAAPEDLLFENSYRLYQLHHILIDMRRHQYYLKEAYKPTLRWIAPDKPKAQYVDLEEDSAYWISREEWQERVDNAMLHTISTKIEDYETRNDGAEVRWVVRHHVFDWENPKHVKALLDNYWALHEYVREKVWTDSYALILDLDRYLAITNLTPVRRFLLQCHLHQMPYPDILRALKYKYGISYNDNHLSTILAKEIPQKIATAAKKYHLIIDTPADQKRVCYHCHKLLPLSNLFFVRNNNRSDKFSPFCKECERQIRIEKGGQGNDDRRNKATKMPKVQTRKTDT